MIYSVLCRLGCFVSLVLLITSCSESSDDKNGSFNFGEPQMVLELENSKLLVSEVAWNLDEPWEISWAEDSHLWITQHKGQVKRLNPKTGDSKIVLSLDDVYFARTPGLMGLAVHPSFNTDPFVYIHYTYADSTISSPRLNKKSKIVRYQFDSKKDTLINPLVILPNIPGSSHHNGARLKITKDEKILFAIGDVGNREGIRDLSVLTGKVLRLNIDGSVPDDNPIKGSYVYSIGHRNPQGLVSANGKIYSSEHGPNNDDELNLILPLKDYGWPFVEGYCDTENELKYCDSLTVQEPLMTWTPTIAPAGLDFYDHANIPEWQNSLLLTSLKGRSLQIIHLNEDGTKVEKSSYFLQKKYGRYRDVCVASNGDVYLITSNSDWHIARQPWMYENVPKDRNDRVVKLSFIPKGDNQFQDLPRIKEDSAQIRLFTQEFIRTKQIGSDLYVKHCAQCHLPSGKGIEDYVPPLTDTKWVNDRSLLIKTTLEGLTGSIEVHGKSYDDVMPGFAALLNDHDVADIATFILNYINGKNETVSEIEVQKIRSALKY